jgi:cytochrome P450
MAQVTRRPCQAGSVTVTVDELERDPHPALARLRATEPVAWLPALSAWLVTRYDLADHVLRDPATFTVDDPRFSTALVVGPSMLSLDGAEHARHRGPFHRSLRPPDRFSPLVVDETRRLVAALPPGRAELRRDLAGPLAVAVVTAALGISGADTATVLGWYDAIVSAVSGVSAGRAIPPEGPAAFAALRARIVSAVPGLDLDETASNTAVLMFGGIETTEGMISNLAVHVLSNPDALRALRADRGLIPAAVEESLRLEPAAAVVERYATRDVELGGAAIRRGDQVTVSIAGANRDPGAFAEPDRFDIHRANARQQLAFARGPHVCIGMDLARLEAATALAALLELPGLRLSGDTAAHGLVFRKPPAVHVLWQPADEAPR